MRSAQLLGRGHLEEGRIACVGEANVAIAISRGGAKKRYSHKEPNEDAVCFAHGAAGTLLAVADGHAGAEASELAMRILLEDAALHWTRNGVERERWGEAAEALVTAVHTAIIAAGMRHDSHARTTLSIAYVQPEEGFCGWISAGDSHIFAIGARHDELGPAEGRPRFLGSPRNDLSALGLRTGCCELPALRAIVLATDGLSERGIGVADPLDAAARAVGSASQHPATRQPLEAARGLAEQAIAAQQRQRAGDNVCTAVCWLADA
ncbi:MAG: protein phosphatase 2C domain-containing protein [Deltaproteobacteria bacterium]|nr:protein phosphatase 2C domain-containing protein [Deltaproteobacteria bacterium]MBW2360121.1 protein phosphatase 2C domain-containing protein [Deltaproteobacteria bacterium]